MSKNFITKRPLKYAPNEWCNVRQHLETFVMVVVRPRVIIWDVNSNDPENEGSQQKSVCDHRNHSPEVKGPPCYEAKDLIKL